MIQYSIRLPNAAELRKDLFVAMLIFGQCKSNSSRQQHWRLAIVRSWFLFIDPSDGSCMSLVQG